MASLHHKIRPVMLVVELGGPTMFARIGVMRALNRGIERVFNPDRKDYHLDAMTNCSGSESKSLG